MADHRRPVPAARAGGGSTAARLEHRYRWLLRAYPAAYRATREEEIITTLMAAAAPGRRVPHLTEAADLVVHGLRRRAGLTTIAGFDGGLALAGPIALGLAAGIAAFAWWRVEPAARDVAAGPAVLGAFRTLGPIAYATWLIAAAGGAVLRPAASRVLVGAAVVTTVVVVPILAAATPYDRPPLWVLAALTAFGALAFGGPPAGSSFDRRLGLPLGAVAVAVSASTVTLAWPSPGRSWTSYYQPTVARVGVVVGAAVAVVAVIALVRLAQGRSGQEWLWATVLLGLPAGWLGPFDTAELRLAAGGEVPHFGRLAQVLLATCVAATAMLWLARHRVHGAALSRAPDRRTLGHAGAVAVGSALGLGAAMALAGTGAAGFAATGPPAGPPRHAVVTLAAVAVAGLAGVLAGQWGRPRGWRLRRVWPWSRPLLRPLLGAVVAAGLAGAVVAAYDNGWTVRGWIDYPRTMALVATIGLVPLSLCVVAAATVLSGPDRAPAVRCAAVAMLAVAGGWLAYLILPYLFAWGPVLLVLAACVATLIVGRPSGPRSAHAS